MALVKCKECGNEVAKNAATCPKCGTRLKMGLLKKLVLGFAGFFVLMIILASLGGSKKNPSSGSAGSNPAAAAAPEIQYKIGDKVELSDSDWTVVGAKDSGKKLKSNNQFQEDAKTDGRFVVVNFRVVNKTPKEERIMDHPALVDSRGREFKDYDHQAFYLPEKAKTMEMEALPSSMPREFWAIYEVPADATGLRFGARELGFSPEKKYVALGF
jgi:zinc-ribbon domain